MLKFCVPRITQIIQGFKCLKEKEKKKWSLEITLRMLCAAGLGPLDENSAT